MQPAGWRRQLVGWPGAGTLSLAHVTFSTAYVAVIVRSRLSSVDESLEATGVVLAAWIMRRRERRRGRLQVQSVTP